MENKPRRIRLHPYTPQEMLALYDVGGPRWSPEVSPQWLAQLRAGGADSWTLGFGVLLLETDAIIGSAGFKGPPDADGMVEIAYGIDPEFQGRGLATEAASELEAIALADKRV